MCIFPDHLKENNLCFLFAFLLRVGCLLTLLYLNLSFSFQIFTKLYKVEKVQIWISSFPKIELCGKQKDAHVPTYIFTISLYRVFSLTYTTVGKYT